MAWGRGYYETIDRNHSGHLTPAQWWATQGVVPPDIVYSERMTLVFGGRTIQLLFPGLNHADDGTVLYFPLERVAFSADFPADALTTTSMRSLPSGCGMFDRHPLAEWIRSYETLESLDFDILAQGHGSVTFTKADVSEGRRYFEDLRAGVAQGMAHGKSLAELKKSLLLEKYKDWAYYDMLREVDIEAAYLNLENYHDARDFVGNLGDTHVALLARVNCCRWPGFRRLWGGRCGAGPAATTAVGRGNQSLHQADG